MPADCITSNTRPTLVCTNCTFDGTAPHYSIVLWRFAALDVEHCQFNGGGGCVCMDTAAKSVHFCFNGGTNISGRIDAATAAKTSFFQCDQIHCPDIIIAWNRCVNVHSARAAVEDVISMNRSGGTSKCMPAIIENNLIDGEYAWPVGSHPSGSGIMGYDPAASGGSSEGGWTIIRGNNVLNCENVGVDVAGSHGVQLLNNVAIKVARNCDQHGPYANLAMDRLLAAELRSSGSVPSSRLAIRRHGSRARATAIFVGRETQTTATGNTYPRDERRR